MGGELDPVAELYSRFPFPPAEPAGKAWKRKYRRKIQEGVKIAHALLDRSPGLIRGHFIDAGCGTGLKLLGMARALPEASFLGADVSQSSLAIARKLITDAGLTNVRLSWASLAEGFPTERNASFDAVICDGVLHHLRSPEEGLKSLVATLKPGGVGWITLFGKYGRADMGRVRKMLNVLEPRFLQFERRLFAARALLKATGAVPKRKIRRLEDDAFLADAALNPRETWFDLVSARRFIEGAGLKLEAWVDGEKNWGEFEVALNAAGLPLEGFGASLSDFERMRLVELWKCPGMLRFIVRKGD